MADTVALTGIFTTVGVVIYLALTMWIIANRTLREVRSYLVTSW